MPNLNETPKIIDFENTLFAGQQANESESRHLTGAEFAEKLKRDLTINGQRIRAVDPGALPSGPEGQDAYMEVTAVGTWTYGGVDIGSNAEGYRTTFWWTGSTWVSNGSVQVKGDQGLAINPLWVPVDSGYKLNEIVRDSSYNKYTSLKDDNVDDLTNRSSWKKEVPNSTVNSDEQLFLFTDQEDNVLGTINKFGELEIKISSRTIDRYSKVKEFDNDDFLVVDPQNNVLNPSNLEMPQLIDQSIGVGLIDVLLKRKKINFEIIAKGRGTDVGSDDEDKVTLISNGVTHPKVLYFEKGLFGYKFWMGLTPTFGPIALKPSPAYYENPHVLCSNNGIDWIEPSGKPIDVTAPLSYNYASYPFWSDTHLVYGDDGYLYCYYRGVGQPKAYVHNNPSLSGLYNVVIVRRKTRDGINWSDREIITSTEDSGVGSSILSPGIDKVRTTLNYYDLITNSASDPIPPQNNQSEVFILRRNFVNENNLNAFSKKAIINLTNRPWGVLKDPWHLDFVFTSESYFLLINVGNIGASMGYDLWLAHSYDGWNFTVFNTPIYLGDSYRSSLTFKKIIDNVAYFDIYRSDTVDGEIDILEIKVKIKD